MLLAAAEAAVCWSTGSLRGVDVGTSEGGVTTVEDVAIVASLGVSFLALIGRAGGLLLASNPVAKTVILTLSPNFSSTKAPKIILALGSTLS